MKNGSPRAELDALLSEELSSAKRREETAFDEAVAPFGDALVLFGAGNLGRMTLAGLRRVGLEPLAFADNNSALWGTVVEGLRVLSPEAAAQEFGARVAFVVTIWGGRGTERMSSRCQQLAALGCAKVVPFASLFCKYPGVFLPHYALDLPHKVIAAAAEVKEAFELFEDDASRQEFVGQIKWRLWFDFEAMPSPVEHEIYFPDDLTKVSSEEIFVDCGAFDGDTVASFIRRHGEAFGTLIAFEPDPANFEKLQQFRESLPAPLRTRVCVYQYAVGAQTGKVYFQACGTEASAVGEGTLEVDSVGLDEFFSERSPTWIKMDIEGSEPDALAGARQIIAADPPLLAVCVYHRQSHLWEIPRLIRSFSPKYNFFLRPHVIEGWDLVCYAVPRDRLGEPQP